MKVKELNEDGGAGGGGAVTSGAIAGGGTGQASFSHYTGPANQLLRKIKLMRRRKPSQKS